VEEVEEDNTDEVEVEEIENDAVVEVNEPKPKAAKKTESTSKIKAEPTPENTPEPEPTVPEIHKVNFIVNGIIVENPEVDPEIEIEENDESNKIITNRPKSTVPKPQKSKRKKEETPDDTDDIYRTKEDEDGQLTLF
jgi:hypothetical protein